jgi:hypothetical protein
MASGWQLVAPRFFTSHDVEGADSIIGNGCDVEQSAGREDFTAVGSSICSETCGLSWFTETSGRLCETLISGSGTFTATSGSGCAQ